MPSARAVATAACRALPLPCTFPFSLRSVPPLAPALLRSAQATSRAQIQPLGAAAPATPTGQCRFPSELRPSPALRLSTVPHHLLSHGCPRRLVASTLLCHGRPQAAPAPWRCLADPPLPPPLALAKAYRAEDATSRLHEMVATCGEDSVDRYTLTSLLQCYCNAGCPDDADAVLQKMSESGWVDEHMLTMVVVAFRKWGKAEGAVGLLGWMEMLGMRPSEKTSSVLVHGFAKQDRVDMAVVIFDKMVSYGSSVDFPMYSVLIEGLYEGNEISKAVKLFERLKRDGVNPDAYLLKRIVMAFCKEGDFAIVVPFINGNAEHLRPTEFISLYNIFLGGLVNYGEAKAAYQLLRSMMRHGQRVGDDDNVNVQMLDIREDVQPNSDSFNSVMCGLCKVKKSDLSLYLTRFSTLVFWSRFSKEQFSVFTDQFSHGTALMQNGSDSGWMIPSPNP